MRLSLSAVLVFAAAFAGCKPSPRPPAPPAPPPPAAPPAINAEEEAWQAIETRNTALVASRDYGAALRVLDMEAISRPSLAGRIGGLKEVVLLAVRGEFAAIDRRARAALERGDEDAAIAAWREAFAFDVAECSDAARISIQEAESARRRRLHQAALPRLGPVLVELQKHLLARDDKAATEMLRRVAAERPELRHEMDWLEGTVIESKGVFGCVRQGLVTMKGESVEIDGGAATVADADDEAATFERPSGRVRVPLAKLPPALFVEAGVRGGGTGDFLGQWLLFTGRIAEARKAFALMKNRPDLEVLAASVESALAGERR